MVFKGTLNVTPFYWKIYLARFNLETVYMHVNTHRGITQKDCSNLQGTLQPLNASHGGLKSVWVVCSAEQHPVVLSCRGPEAGPQWILPTAGSRALFWPSFCDRAANEVCASVFCLSFFFFFCSVGTKRSFCFEDVPLTRKRFKYFRSAH